MMEEKAGFFGLLKLENDNKKRKTQEMDTQFENELRSAPGFVSVERKVFGFFSTYQVKTTDPNNPYYQNLNQYHGVCVKILQA